MTGLPSDLMERRARRLVALLRATDVPAPALRYPEERIARAVRRRAVLRWRVAAAVALLVAGAAGVPPVRAWIVQAARAVWAAASGAKAAPKPPAAPSSPAGAVSFRPSGTAFVVRVARVQAGGTLTIETTPGPLASAAVRGGTVAGELLVLPAGLEIANDPASTAGYAIRLPATLGRIYVWLGPAAAPRVLVPHRVGETWVLDLGAPR